MHNMVLLDFYKLKHSYSRINEYNFLYILATQIYSKQISTTSHDVLLA